MADKVIISKDKLDSLADSINIKAGTSGNKNIDELKEVVDKISTEGFLQEIKYNKDFQRGYWTYSYGSIIRRTSSAVSYTIDNPIKLDKGQIYKVLIPCDTVCEINLIFTDENNKELYRVTPSNNGFTFVADLDFLYIYVSYVDNEETMQKYLSNLYILKDIKHQAVRVPLSTNISDWEIGSLSSKVGTSYEDSKVSSTTKTRSYSVFDVPQGIIILQSNLGCNIALVQYDDDSICQKLGKTSNRYYGYQVYPKGALYIDNKCDITTEEAIKDWTSLISIYSIK